jgi:hypothetical protein
MKPRPVRVALLAALLAAPAAHAAAQTPAPALTAAAIHALVQRTIMNQHRNDRDNYAYERVERRLRFSGSRATDDRTYRVVPTGTGTLSLLVKEDSQPVNLDSYLNQLRTWEQVLTVALDPNDSRERAAEEKRRKRDHDRAQLVDAVGEAFQFTWLGRETLNGRNVVKLRLDPNPAYQPRSSSTDLLTHVQATVWIDEQAAQLVRAQARIIRDITIGGGILGKIYKSGWFEIVQAQVAPAAWEPALVEYSVAARKFLFPSAVHARTQYRRYRRVGSPREALALARTELKSGQAFAADP